MTTEDTSALLNGCTNVFGPLNPDTRARLQAVINEPTAGTWNDAYSIVLNHRTGRTLWQAVLMVDPRFPQTAGTWRRDYDATPVEKWPYIPSEFTIRRAIQLAVLEDPG